MVQSDPVNSTRRAISMMPPYLPVLSLVAACMAFGSFPWGEALNPRTPDNATYDLPHVPEGPNRPNIPIRFPEPVTFVSGSIGVGVSGMFGSGVHGTTAHGFWRFYDID
jgi:hypothetical protein